MRAIQITRFGGPDVLRIADLPRPAPGPDEVLIRVAASGVNFADTLMREGTYISAYGLPVIPGSEVAGVVEEVGGGVSDFAPGARVAAVLVAAKVLTGGYAEYCVAKAAVTVELPGDLAFDAATALLVQGLTALSLVREVDPAGLDVLITAAGGGVGSLLIQLALRAGARRVMAAASTSAKREMALSLGAHIAFDYADIPGSGPELIYESVGGTVLPTCLKALAPKGMLAIYGALNLQHFHLGTTDLKRLMFENQLLRGFTFAPLLELARLKTDLATLFSLASKRKLKPVIGRAYPLDRASEAHRALGARTAVGKQVLTP